MSYPLFLLCHYLLGLLTMDQRVGKSGKTMFIRDDAIEIMNKTHCYCPVAKDEIAFVVQHSCGYFGRKFMNSVTK